MMIDVPDVHAATIVYLTLVHPSMMTNHVARCYQPSEGHRGWRVNADASDDDLVKSLRHWPGGSQVRTYDTLDHIVDEFLTSF